MRHIFWTSCLLSFLLCLLLVANPSAYSAAAAKSANTSTVNIQGRNCRHGLQRQPNEGPFAVIVFCEGAAGSFLAVVCYSVQGCEKAEYPDGAKRFEGWGNNKRVWQDDPWTSDVTSIAWSPDRKSLFVATSEIYGSGALYQLNLEDRKYKQLLPKAPSLGADGSPGPGYEIDSIDENGKFLLYHVQEISDDDHSERLKLSIK